MSEIITLMIIQIIIDSIIALFVATVPFIILYISSKLSERKEIRKRNQKIQDLYTAFEGFIKFNQIYDYAYIKLHKYELELIGVIPENNGFRICTGEYGDVTTSNEGKKVNFNTYSKPHEILSDIGYWIRSKYNFGVSGRRRRSFNES